jgi:fluoride exporter
MAPKMRGGFDRGSRMPRQSGPVSPETFRRPCKKEFSRGFTPVIGFWIALGGGIGAIARFGIGGWVTTWAYAGFPWPTFGINVLGSLALGFLVRALPAPRASPAARAFFTAGLCGGFTTFSTFDFETLALLQQQEYSTAALYSLGSAGACIAGVFGGGWLAGCFMPREDLADPTPQSTARR